MENVMNQQTWNQIAEVELIYKSKVKASERPKVTSSKDVADISKQNWDENKIDFVEQFKVLFLNRSNQVLGIMELFSGGVTGTVADPRLIYVAALKANSTAIVISHYVK